MGLAQDSYDIADAVVQARAKEGKKVQWNSCQRSEGEDYFQLYIDRIPYEFSDAASLISFLDAYINS